MKNNMENNKKQQTAFSILDVVQQVEKAILDVFVEKEIDLDDAIKILGLAAGELIDTCPNEKKLSENIDVFKKCFALAIILDRIDEILALWNDEDNSKDKKENSRKKNKRKKNRKNNKNIPVE